MQRKWILFVFGAASFSLAGCGNKEADGAGSPPSSANPGATGTGAVAASSGKTVHLKHVQDECTFDVDAPEALKESQKDGMSTTYKGTNFWFQGFAGSAHYGLEQLTGLATMGSKEPPVYKGTANGVNLVITRAPQADANSKVLGQGEDSDKHESGLGCSYLCGGPAEREADVIAMCKSVKIQYDKSKVK
ncbi:MAG: hypothetical protein IPK82_19880 [Polyangiaceae bacterium]|nr:hypothetical protein [Polyangiaceae bacterium]